MRLDIIQRTVEYWSSQRDGRKLPTRRSIDPVELADLLANLVLVEVLDGGRDYLNSKMTHTLIHGGTGSILPAHLKRRIWRTSRQTMGLIVRLRLSSYQSLVPLKRMRQTSCFAP